MHHSQSCTPSASAVMFVPEEILSCLSSSDTLGWRHRQLEESKRRLTKASGRPI